MRLVMIVALMLACFGAVGFSADLAGTWKGVAETPNGTIERTFVFKVNGTVVTGETNSPMMGKSTISDGKLEGDKLTFTIVVKFQDNEMKINYSGKVAGDTIKFTATSADGNMTLEYSAKRVS